MWYRLSVYGKTHLVTNNYLWAFKFYEVLRQWAADWGLGKPKMYYRVCHKQRWDKIA